MNWKSILMEDYARRGKIIAAILTASLLPLAVTAQEAEEEMEEAEDDIVELSPFVVDETATVGYLATQTLAGTRIASQLKDVAASVFVYTPELMEDTGMTEHSGRLHVWRQYGGSRHLHRSRSYIHRPFGRGGRLLELAQ